MRAMQGKLRTTPRWFSALVMGAALLVNGAAVRAQEMPGEGEIAAADVARARALFAEGESAFDTGDYVLALARFEEAYRLSQRPELLYNIAFCEERLGNDEAALSGYELFVEALPDAPNRADVERRIAVQRERIARAAVAVAPSGTPASHRRAPFDPAPAILGVSSAAVIAVGIVLVAVGATQRNNLAATEDGRREWTDVESELVTADVLVGVGIGAMGLGVLGAGVALGWGLSGGGAEEPGDVRAVITGTGLSIQGWM